MDRFKFRGKRLDSGELVYGSLVREENDWYITTFEDVCVDTDCNSWELKLVLVGIVPGSQEQCAGLKDKNGKLIWEGDVVKIVQGSMEWRYVVRHIKGYAGLWAMLIYRNFDINEDGDLTMGDVWTIRSVRDHVRDVMEVIGNVHENQELMSE